ncbi:MAG: metallophosphoesterase, partial [Acetatifactor sp.]|nr:metallophosphoesterase [Acetatifactor sp.]
MAHRIKTTIQEIAAKPGQRLLVVSDIHGHLDRFTQLLRQMDYSGEDILILVGDLIEKGPESLRVVQYVMDLARQHPVYVSMGNVDLGRLLKVDDDSTEGVENWAGFLRWAERAWGGSLFHEMLADMGIPADQVTGERTAEYRSCMLEQFHEELEFLWSRPTILTAGKYLFVHGGISTEDLQSLEGTDPSPYLKNDDFLSQGHAFREHIVVTGHWPTCLYRVDREDVSPVFDSERQILCIDGGNGLKRSGQLNGIIIPDCQAQMDQISWTGYDGFPVVEALGRQEGRAADVHIQYFESQVELLEQREDMALWRQVSTGKSFEAPVKWTYHDGDGRLHYSDYADTWLDVEPGDRLSVIVQTSAGYYCKKDGLIGWYKGTARPVEQKLTLLSGFLNTPAPDRKACPRRERELAVYELLEKLEIEYQRIDHVQANTMEA